MLHELEKLSGFALRALELSLAGLVAQVLLKKLTQTL